MAIRSLPPPLEIDGDVAQHIAHGMAQSHGWGQEDTLAKIKQAFLENIEHQERKLTGGTTADIAGPHLLLQAVPQACARAVSEFATRLGTNSSLKQKPLRGST